MQFIVMGYDGKDKDASRRRLEVRQEHLDNVVAMKKEKSFYTVPLY